MSLSTITPNKAVVVAVGGFLIYWLLALFTPAAILRDVFNSLAFGAAVIITVTWAPTVWHSIHRGSERGEWQLILAIFIVWFVIMCQRVYIIAFNWQGRPEAWAQGPIGGFWPYSFTMAGLLFLVAPGVRAEGVRSRAMWAIIAAVGIGSLTAGILIGASIPTG